MGFWSVVGSIGKGVLSVAGALISAGLDNAIEANKHREEYNNSNLSKEEMIKKYNSSCNRAEKGGIEASMKDKGYRD